jgi:hypothetical protein
MFLFPVSGMETWLNQRLHARLMVTLLAKDRAALLWLLFGVCSDTRDLTIETLEKQYEMVKIRVSNNGTYNQVSSPPPPPSPGTNFN